MSPLNTNTGVFNACEITEMIILHYLCMHMYFLLPRLETLFKTISTVFIFILDMCTFYQHCPPSASDDGAD